MAAEYKLGARANCSDGHCGEVVGTILDPDTDTVTHLVVQHAHRRTSGRLVPIELVDETTDQMDEIRLRCTMAGFDRLDSAQEVDVVEDAGYGGYESSASVQGYGDLGSLGGGGSASGLGIGMSLGHRTPTIVTDNVPLGEEEVGRHEHVHALDGEIGLVEGFVVNADHQVTHVLLQEGHLWGRKEVAIPISAVERVDEGIRLNITKQQVEDLPPVGKN
jgi:sporulation protein YlmC with PRC-barrel domain